VDSIHIFVTSFGDFSFSLSLSFLHSSLEEGLIEILIFLRSVFVFSFINHNLFGVTAIAIHTTLLLLFILQKWEYQQQNLFYLDSHHLILITRASHIYRYSGRVVAN
jgi:hypothetical protein